MALPSIGGVVLVVAALIMRTVKTRVYVAGWNEG
jgi:hypothetical protein